MSNRLKDRVAIITGSGLSEIGKEEALAMAKEGATVVTNDVALGAAEAVAKEITGLGGQAVAFTGDISKFEVARKLIQTAVDNFGRLDILVNNAGFAAHRMLCDMTEEDWNHTIAVTLTGTFNCTRHACAVMKEQRWGRIINTTSTARLGVREECSHGAANAGVVGLTKAVALEMADYGVTCNAISPSAASGVMLSEWNQARFKRWYEAGLVTEETYRRVRNPPSAAAIPPLVIYLCTDEAADITGQVFLDYGWKIGIYPEEVVKNLITKEGGWWTVEELIELLPKSDLPPKN